MRAGELRHRIDIKSVPATKSGTGADIPGAATVFAGNVWARIESASGALPYGRGRGEPFGGGKDYSQMTHVVRIRYQSGIIPTMQVHGLNDPWAGRNFDIVEVDNTLGRKRELILYCREYRTSATP